MPLSNYDELVKEITSWCHKGNQQTSIPLFIQLAEIEMYNNEGWQLEVRDMEFTSFALTDGRYIDLPERFEKARSVQLETGGGLIDVKFQSPEQLMMQPATGRPSFFTIIGNQIEFNRPPDNEYTIQMQYYKRPENLSEENQTNSVLTNHPNIYLYGSLHQLYLKDRNTEQTVIYFSKMQSAIRGANKAAKKARFGPAPTMRIEGVIP